MKETLIIIVKDGLMLPSGVIDPSSYTCNFFCRIPEKWIEDGNLKKDFLEKIFEKVYGQTWRTGNGDGSRCVIENFYSKIFTADLVKSTAWSSTKNDQANHYWFYIVSETGIIKQVSAAEFQTDVDSSFQAAAEVISSDNSGLLTIREKWLKEPLNEEFQAQYALEILKKYFTRAGLPVRENEKPPATWWSFCLSLYLNLDPRIGKSQYHRMVRDIFEELVELARQIPDEYFVYRLLEMLERFIDRDPPRSIIEPLLPLEAQEKMEEMDQILADRHEEYLRRMDQMGY